MNVYTCRLTEEFDGVRAQVHSDDHIGRPDTTGTGACGLAAISSALGMKGTEFASAQDEVETCIAAMRGLPLKVVLIGRTVQCRTMH